MLIKISSFKISLLIVVFICIFTESAYSINSSKTNLLRTPLLSNSKRGRERLSQGFYSLLGVTNTPPYLKSQSNPWRQQNQTIVARRTLGLGLFAIRLIVMGRLGDAYKNKKRHESDTIRDIITMTEKDEEAEKEVNKQIDEGSGTDQSWHYDADGLKDGGKESPEEAGGTPEGEAVSASLSNRRAPFFIAHKEDLYIILTSVMYNAIGL